MKKIYIGIIIGICLCFSKVNAEELKDGYKIKDNVEITSYNSSDVYVEGKKIEIENFETLVDGKNIYRKYVSLDDLIKVIPTISYNITDNDNIITVKRKYDKQVDGFDVYYETEHDISKRTFTSVLFVGKDDKIQFGDETREEVVTADADTFKIDDKLYISLRFLTEALGAEVVHKTYSDVESALEDKKAEKVTIDFYSNEKYAKVIEMEWKNESGTGVTIENILSSNNECFIPNFSYKYMKEGETELKSITNTYVKIYTDDNFKWNINDKKLCSVNGNTKTLNSSTVIVKYRGVPVIIDINNLGISEHCGIEKLSLEENCDIMKCETNPSCGMALGEYYCCNEGANTSDDNQNNDNNNNTNSQSDELEIIFIGSVFYDDAILISDGQNTIFIDGGRKGADKTVIPFLQDKNISNIDLLIGSHLDYDHIQIGADIINNFSVKSVTYPDDLFTCLNRNTCVSEDQKYIVDALKNNNLTPTITKPEDKIQIGEMTLYFLAPDKISTGNYAQNMNSSIFILKYKNNSFMFTGDADIDDSVVSSMINHASNLGISMDVDILKYPHHGNSTVSNKLLDTTKPEYIIVPNRNASQFPKSENKSRIENHGIKMYRQSDSSTGHIRITSDGNNINVYSDYQ